MADVTLEEFRDALKLALEQTEAGETGDAVKSNLKYKSKDGLDIDASYKSPTPAP